MSSRARQAFSIAGMSGAEELQHEVLATLEAVVAYEAAFEALQSP